MTEFESRNIFRYRSIALKCRCFRFRSQGHLIMGGASMDKIVNIAIDGPSGAGKSTIAKLISRKLGYLYMDTGALYRAVGLFVLRLNIDSKDESSVCERLKEIEIILKHSDGEQRVFLNGEDVSDKIRTPEVSKYASDVSAMPKVREALLYIQKSIAAKQNVVMDGRDIGTVILPNADIKIFLTASADDRAKRRYDEMTLKGMTEKFEDVLSDIIQRDKNDSQRSLAPLKIADDAIYVDTTGYTLDKSAALIEKIIREKL